MRFTAASSYGCSMRITTNTVSSRLSCSTEKAASSRLCFAPPNQRGRARHTLHRHQPEGPQRPCTLQGCLLPARPGGKPYQVLEDAAADRTSCTKATANQLRLFLHAGAYWLMW